MRVNPRKKIKHWYDAAPESKIYWRGLLVWGGSARMSDREGGKESALKGRIGAL